MTKLHIILVYLLLPVGYDPFWSLMI